MFYKKTYGGLAEKVLDIGIHGNVAGHENGIAASLVDGGHHSLALVLAPAGDDHLLSGAG